MSPGQPDTSFAFFSGVTCQESVHYIINQEEEIENTHYRLFLTQIPAYYSGLLGMFKWQLYKSALCVPACRFETACRLPAVITLMVSIIGGRYGAHPRLLSRQQIRK